MQKKYFIFFLITFAFSCSKHVGPGQWQSLASIDGSEPIERHEAAFIAIGDKFYLLGGRGIRPISIYDTKTKNWSKGSPPPFEIHHFQPLVHQSKIYMVGAFTGGWPNERPVANIIIYDPETDQWETGAEIPEDRRRGGAGAAIYKGKIYLACGIKNGHVGDHKKWLDTYDLETETWSQLPDAPRERDHFNAVVADDKLFLLAGRTSKTDGNNFSYTIAEVDVFNFKTQGWKTLPQNLPTLRAGNAALLFHDEILVIGGESDTQELAHNEVEALHVKSYNWRKLNPLLQGRHGTSAILQKGKIFLASGCGNRGGEPELKTMECFSVK